MGDRELVLQKGGVCAYFQITGYFTLQCYLQIMLKEWNSYGLFVLVYYRVWSLGWEIPLRAAVIAPAT